MIITQDGTKLETTPEQRENIVKIIQETCFSTNGQQMLNLNHKLHMDYIKDIFGGLDKELFPKTYDAVSKGAEEEKQESKREKETECFTRVYGTKTENFYDICATAFISEPSIQMTLRMDVYGDKKDGICLLHSVKNSFSYLPVSELKTKISVERKEIDRENSGILLTVTWIDQNQSFHGWTKIYDWNHMQRESQDMIITITDPVHRIDKVSNPEDPYILQYGNNSIHPNVYDYCYPYSCNTYFPLAGMVKFKNPKLEVLKIDDVTFGEGSNFIIKYLSPENKYIYYNYNNFLNGIKIIKGGFEWNFKNVKWNDISLLMERNTSIDCVLDVAYKTNFSAKNHFIISSILDTPGNHMINYFQILRGNAAIPKDPVAKVSLDWKNIKLNELKNSQDDWIQDSNSAKEYFE